MSLILKGIDLPIEGELRLIISKNGMICGAEYPKVRHTYPLNLDAEAIQIPKDHGRLIDGGALETVFKDMAKCEWNQKASPISWAYAFEDTIDEIHDAPTILEAEEDL